MSKIANLEMAVQIRPQPSSLPYKLPLKKKILNIGTNLFTAKENLLQFVILQNILVMESLLRPSLFLIY